MTPAGLPTDCENFAEAVLSGGRPGDPALVCGSQTTSHGQLRQAAHGWARRLAAEGLAKGQRVGLLAENGPLFAAAYLGAIRAGLCVVPLQTDCSEKNFRHVAAATGLTRLVVSPRLRPRVQSAAAELGVALLGEGDASPATDAPPADEFPAIDPRRDLAAIMPTSGSTGLPKGVMVTHQNLFRNTRDILSYMNLTPADRAMVVLPFYYCYGASLLHTHLMTGASLVINNRFMFLGKVLDELDKQRCTGLAGVPSTYQLLLRQTHFAKRRFPSLRWLQQAGGRLPNVLIGELRRAFPAVRLYVMYGQTEATARLSYLPPERLEDKLGSIGRGLPGTRLEVLRPDGAAVRPGSDETGEIVASGENISPGYWNDPEETARYFRGGRLYTGDIARVDAEGFIYIVERTRDFIKSMGNRVSPMEVEEVIAEMPEVVEAAVVGVPHELWGEALKVFIVTGPAGRLTAKAVRAHCLARLPNYKIPEYVEFLPRLPKTANGKVAKEELRAAASSGSDGTD